MKSNLRKALALLLTLIMVMTSLPTSALAEMVTDLAKSVTDVSEGKQLFGDAFVSPLSIVDDETNKYITYTFRNEKGEEVDKQIVKNGDTLYEPASPEKDGYMFTGWYNGETKFNGFGVQSEITATTEVTLTARFEEVHYVFFMENADEKARVFKTKATTKDNLTTIATDDVTAPEEDGYGFIGWYYDRELTQPVKNNEVDVSKGNVTLWPRIEKGSWLIFESMGGTYVAPEFYTPGEPLVEPAAPTREGYKFLHWSAEKDGAEFKFNTTLTADTNKTLYAVWKAVEVSYTVIHWHENANDDGYSFYAMDTLSGITGEKTQATAKKENVSGKNLLGATVRDQVFTAETVTQETIKGDGSTIVNIYYARKSYTLYFKESEDSYSNLNTLTKKWGENISKEEWPTNYGNSNWQIVDGGWNDTSRYLAYTSTMPMTDGKLWATSGSYTVSATYYVEKLGGTGYEEHHTDTIKVNGRVRVGAEDRYAIDGFELDTTRSTKEGEYYNGAKFYYNRKSFQVIYVNNGSKANTETYKYQADITDAGEYVPARPDGVPSDYIFDGWFEDPAGTRPYNFNGKTMPSGNITVYAKWSAPKYNVNVFVEIEVEDGSKPYRKFEIVKGGKVDTDELEEAKKEVLKNHLNVDWLGWTMAVAGASERKPFNPAMEVTQSITLYPNYIDNGRLSITYVNDAEDSTGTVPTDTRAYAKGSEANILSPEGLSVQGKVFLGWNTKANGSGTMYQPGDKVKMTDDITLYAIWGEQAATTSITYHANFGNPEKTYTDSNIKNNAKVTVKTYEATYMTTRPGYTFKGWAKSADATAADYQPGAEVRLNGTTNNDLYAVWEVVKVALTVEKQWLGDEGYTDNRVPLTLTIGRKAKGLEENWNTVELSAENAQSGNANVWRREFNVETHDEDGHAYTYYIKKEKATADADQATLNLFYSPDTLDTANLTTDDKTLTAKNTLATKELTITKTIANAPQSYMNETFKFEVKKSDGSMVTLLQKNDDGTTTRINEIRLRNGGTITLILPIDTYTVYEVFEGKQKDVWQAQNPVTVNLAAGESRAEFTNSLQTKEIKVNKVWLDDAGTKHDAVTVTVTGTNVANYSDSKTFAENVTFDVPAKTVAGAEAQYKVQETVVDGYKTYYKIGDDVYDTAPTGVYSGDTVTIYNVKTGSVTVQKKWDNISAADRDKLTVKGTLKYSVLGKEYTPDFEIDKNDANWTITIPDIPQFDLNTNDGKVHFTVEETDITDEAGNTVMKDFQSTVDSLTITNTYKGEGANRTITVNKTWQRPAYMTTDGGVVAEFTLYRYIGTGFVQDDLNDLDNTAKWTIVDTKNLSEPKSNWKITEGTATADNTVSFAPVPKYDANGNEIIYAVKEAGELGYYTSTPAAKVDNTTNSVSFTNTMAESATLTIRKTAFDVDGTELHAGTFTFKIRRGDAVAKTVTIDLTKGGSESVNLVPGTYTVTETGADAWDTTYTVTADGITTDSVTGKEVENVATGSTVSFVNKRIKGSITVYKQWVDGNSRINVRPEPKDYKGWLELYQRQSDGSWAKYNGATLNVTTTEGNPLYTITYSGMPEKATDGTPFIYAVKETIPADKNYYTLTVDDAYKVTGTDGAVLVKDGGTMTNTLSLGSLTIEKVIEDASDENYSVGFDFTVKLNGEGNGVPATVTVASTTKTGTATVSNLPVGSYTVKETLVAGWSVDEATKSASVTTNGGSVTFKNTRQLYPLTVTKQWVDGENKPLEEKDQPDKLTVTITRSTNSQQIEMIETLTKEDDLTEAKGEWTKTLPNLPRFAPDGTVYTYAVSESLQSGYEQKNAEVTFDSVNNKYTVTLVNAKTAESEQNPTKELDEYTRENVLIVNPVTGEKDMVKVGDKLTYTITYKNHLDTPQRITITDTLPEGLDFAEDNTPDWKWDSNTRIAKLELEDVPAFKEDSVTITVVVTEKALIGGSDPKVKNTATVSIGEGTQTATSGETTVYKADFTVTKTVDTTGYEDPEHPHAEGETVKFIITVTNTGNVPLTNVKVADELFGKGVLVDSQGNLVKELTIANIAVGGSEVIHGQYVVTYEDMVTNQKENPNMNPKNTVYVTAAGVTKDAETFFEVVGFQTLKVTKEWDDKGNALGVRPSSVTVQLQRDGDDYAPGDTDGQAVLSADNDWTYTFENLPAMDKDENSYTYSVREILVGSVDAEKSDYKSRVVAPSGSPEVTNTLKLSDNTVSIKKEWNDDNNSYGLRPKPTDFAEWVRLERKKGENWVEYTGIEKYPVSKAVSDDYTVTFTGMPMYDANGNKYQYRIVEINVPDYYNGVSTDTALVNSLVTRNVIVKKTLEDDSYGAPETQTFRFYVARTDGTPIASFGGTGFAEFKQDSDGNCYFEIAVEKGKTARATLTLPVGTYTITEETNDAWTTKVGEAEVNSATVTLSEMAEADQTVTFANTRVLYDNKEEPGTINVTKIWKLLDEKQTTYPDVTFTLMQKLGDAEATAYQTLTLAGTLSGQFTNVPKYAPDGTKYVYTVMETNIPTGYVQDPDVQPTVVTDENGTTWTFTNKQLGADAIAITKKWEDDGDKFGLRPGEKTFKEYVKLARSTDNKNWELFDWDKTVSKKSDNEYTVVFSGMPQTNDSGDAYIYRVVEYKTPDEYYTASSDNDYMTIGTNTLAMYAWAANGETITNTLKTETLTIKKVVEGYVGDATGNDLTFSFTISPSDNKVKMDKMETPTIPVKPTERSAETYVTLPVGEYTVTENHNDAWTVSVSHDDTVAAGEPTPVPEPGTTPSPSISSSATLRTGYTVTFYNTRNMFNGDGKYTVVKNWQRYDENEAFPNVTIELSDGTRTRSVELKSEDVQVDGQNASMGSISHIFENLPAYDLEGKELTYTATESYIPGYTAGEPVSSDVSTTFTNTANSIVLTVNKVWQNGDGTEYKGERPESVTVKLWRKGEEKAYKTAELNADNDWTYSFTVPTHNADGDEYIYSVSEDPVMGFELVTTDLTFVKNEESDNPYSVTLVNQKTMSEEVPSEKTVEADFKTVQITDDATGKMVEDGAQLTYTITYFNHFSDPKTIVITDTLDPNVSFDPADNPGVKSYDADSRTVRWEIPDVQPGTGDKVELTVRVALTDEAKETSDPKIPNTATVNIGNDATQTAESENVTVYHPRLKVEKITANVPTKGYYALGETAEFEITASNTGNVLLENIVITEQLEGAQFVQSDDYTVEDGKAIIAALNPGQSVVVRAQYTVKLDDLYAEDDQQQAPMKNIVTATAQSGDDPVDGGDESEFKPDQLTHLTVEKHWVDDLAVQRGDVRVQLTADGESYTADSRYNHEVIISSKDILSPADTNVWVIEFDNLPKHNADGSEIRYSAVETHVDGHGTVTDGRCDGYDVTVADDPAAHTTVITNTAQRKKFIVHKVWRDGEGNLAESLIPDTELTVALFVDGFDMNDDDFRTTLTRANGWEGKIDRMFAYNQAGVAYEYTPMEMDANGNAIADGGSIVIDGVTYDVSITTQTEPDANRAEAHRDVNVTITNTRRSDDPEENKPTKEANLAPGKTTVSVGDSLTYTISYHNSRNVKADVTITDVLAESLNFGSASHGGTYNPATRTVTWVLRDVAAFASDAVTLTVTVNEKAKQADDAAAVKNTATVVIPGNQPVIRYDTNTVEIPVEPEEGVKPTKKAVGIDPAKDTVEIGQKVEYRIGYRNHKNTAVSVRIVDKLDDGVKFISASDGGVYDAAKHTVFWNIAKLAPFADGEVTLTVEVTEAARKLAEGETMATVNNTATVKFDNDPETETNVVDIPVKPNDPKKPEKKAEGLNATDTKKVGDEIVYTITYVNNLNKKAKVVVTDALDEGVDFVEADNGGVYDKASHTVTWTFDSVDPFEGDAVKLTVKVNEKARQIKEGETTATVDNTAAVTVDNKTTTISDPVEIPVTPDKPTDPTKKADDKALNSFGKIAVGDQLPFTVSYVNNLNTVATVTVRDTLEEGLTFVSADNGGTYDEATRTVTWVLKDVAPFTSGSVTVITEVNENAVDAADPTVANSAMVKIGDQPEQTTEPAEVTVYNPDFSVEKKLTNLPAKGYFTAGETAAFDITVKNTGNVPLENVAVEELLDGVTFVQGEGYTIDGRIATIAALPIGEQIVLKAEYTVIEADLGNTDLANRITVRGEVPENPDDPDQPHNPEDKGDEEPIPVDECVEITGTKTWNDADNAYGARPDVILVMLLANGEEKIGTRASAETEWKYTFIQQPKHDADGNEVVYSIREEEVPGYDTTYSAEGYDITNTLRRHTLTIRYWIDEVGGEQAFKTFTRDYYYGERYNVVSPAMDGYRADHEVVSGRIEGDLEVDVVYTAILWRLNIRYRRVGDGKTLAPMYTNGNVIIGDAYEVESPVIPGYTADRPVVKGEMHGRNMSFTVWYTPEQTEVVIVDEKTPFGLGNVVMNAGDCFE